MQFIALNKWLSKIITLFWWLNSENICKTPPSSYRTYTYEQWFGWPYVAAVLLGLVRCGGCLHIVAATEVSLHSPSTIRLRISFAQISFPLVWFLVVTVTCVSRTVECSLHAPASTYLEWKCEFFFSCSIYFHVPFSVLYFSELYGTTALYSDRHSHGKTHSTNVWSRFWWLDNLKSDHTVRVWDCIHAVCANETIFFCSAHLKGFSKAILA